MIEFCSMLASRAERALSYGFLKCSKKKNMHTSLEKKKKSVLLVCSYRSVSERKPGLLIAKVNITGGVFL